MVVILNDQFGLPSSQNLGKLLQFQSLNSVHFGGGNSLTKPPKWCDQPAGTGRNDYRSEKCRRQHIYRGHSMTPGPKQERIFIREIPQHLQSTCVSKIDVSKNRGIPKWMAFRMENPIKMDDLRVFPIFLETPNYFWLMTGSL